MIKYFVSYACWDKDGNQGFGNGVFDSIGKLDNIENIQHTEKQITKNMLIKML